MGIDIRRARLEDADDILVVVQQAYKPFVARLGQPPGPMLDNYAEMIREHTVYIIEAGKAIAAVLVLIEKDDYFLLDNVVVAPDYQGQGLGRRLLDLAEQEALRRGWDAIQLYTHERMHENIAIYESRGYIEFDRRTERNLNRVYFKKSLGVS